MNRLQFIKSLFGAPVALTQLKPSAPVSRAPFKRGDRVYITGQGTCSDDRPERLEAIVIEGPDPEDADDDSDYGLLILYSDKKPSAMWWFDQYILEGRPGTRQEGWEILDKYHE